ncbi:MAG: cytochrome C oxidase subunit II [Gemmatimonadota bacterium]|nr:cytochrome C oxidase subunit II [Gemmatimonadota bacterium]
MKLSLLTAFILFAWMVGWARLAHENPAGETLRIGREAYMAKVFGSMKEGRHTPEGLVPAGEDVFVGAQQWMWVGLPVVLQAGKEYRVHLGSFDVQHGFGVHREKKLIEQFSLQVLPGYEWILPMRFTYPGTYDVECNEFCGVGHRTMHGQIIIK